MRIAVTALLFLTFWFSGQAVAVAQSAVSVPPLHYAGRTLANGARVYAIRDTSSATASVNIWYDVGQRDDPRGRGGFAHLFEHLMFKTTRNLPQGVMGFLTEIGGESNATTLFDTTLYYVTVPANRLEALLWMEGERLSNLVVDEAAFRSERDVVKEELRQRIFAQPYGRILHLLLPAYTFDGHPYQRPIGGTITDLDQATLADVRAFHETYYRPDNAIFVISGNFDPAELDTWVDRYIGSIPRPTTPMPRDRATGTERRALTIDTYAPNVPLPALVFSWRAPPADNADVAGLSVIEAILTRGRSGRLRRQLVDAQQLASNVTSFNFATRDGHAFSFTATLAQGRDLAEAEAAFGREIARLRDTPIDAAELDAVKNAMLGDALTGREVARGRAFELGDAVSLTGDPDAADRRLAAIRDVTAEDLQRIARHWLADARRVTIRYRDETARPAGYTGDAAPDVATLGTIVPPASRPPVTLAAEGDRVARPAAGAEVARAIPAIAERTLPNGLRVVAARSSDIPLVTLRLVIGGGDAADPGGRAGLADVMAALALRGAGGRDAGQLAQAVAALGGSIASSADADATSISLTVPAANAAAAGDLLADIARRPAFATEELERARRQQADALAVSARQPMQAALRVLMGAMTNGVPAATTLTAIRPEDVAGVYRSGWGPRNATLIVTGALTGDQAFALAGRLFGDWQGGTAFTPARRAASAPQVLVVDIPSAGQTAVLAGLPAVGRDDPAWPEFRLANARLGSGRQSLLNEEIRVRRGLSYGAGSIIDERRGGSFVFAATQTRNDAADQVVGLVLEQMRRLSAEPMTAPDLALRAAALTNGLGSQTERTSGLADYLARLVTAGAPLTMARIELAGGDGPDSADITRFAARYVRPEAATIVVAGDSQVWIEALRQRFPGLRQVTVDGVPAS
ncbi:pitrilysin family protein [Sphingosinicella sp. LHD-64]|uniref:M16 family metallopeptidase n=1 Tax=Sphingosinicella sp. LHD-64 TaxID=3072139 RepID=UPI00280EEF59|nr:pitrilysin family protein [Sphingosinicella sp. LHD-64]MDQ8754986.1 pitrilysin family protein [Sphingosinicella sp. LHD-64]